MIRVDIIPYWELYAFSCVGALLLWTKMTNINKKVHGFGDILEKVAPNSPRFQYLTQFIIFVFLGGFVGVLAVGPYTQLQALAGGVAWSRLMAKD